MLSCRLTFGLLWLGIYLFLWWFLLVLFGLFLLHWRYELPCQDKLPEFHYTPILGCIRVLWLVSHPLGLGLDKALCGWNSVMYDSTHHKFIVTKPSGKEFAFQESEGGLHYLDTTCPQYKQQQHQQQGHVFAVNTVRDNKKNVTNNNYLRALRAQELQVMVGCPSDKDLIKILKTSSLPNCPVMPRDVIIANKLFGPDIGTLKGKTTRRGPPIVDSPMSVDTTSMLEHYGEVTLCVDLMYVNKVPLLVTLSRNIKFGTMEAVADWKEATLLKCIKGVISLYQKARFKVTVTLMDGEFMPLCGGLAELGICLNETSRDEHVRDIE